MIANDVASRVAATVAERFDEQVAFLQRFVAIPSTRGAEAPAQTWMAEALAARGYAVDRWRIDRRDLEPLPGYAPVVTAFDDAWGVVGTHTPRQGGGRSLILQGHCDVVPEGPADGWSTPPYEPVIRNGWMHGRGAGDMKSGTVAALFALDALAAIGLRPAGRVHFQSVIEEESTGAGALATLQRGYRADLALIPEPTGMRLVRAQVGVLWFRLSVRGRPVHASVATSGANAIEAAFHLLGALRGLEATFNQRAKSDPRWRDHPHPLNLNPGIIRGGDWASSVPAWCDLDCRLGLLPGWDVATAQAEVAASVAQAAAAHPFLTQVPPEITWNGFLAEGWTLPEGSPGEAELSRAWQAVAGAPVADTLLTGLTDTRFYGRHGIPALCFGPKAENIHGYDERVDLASLRAVTTALALFIADWCGVEPL
jgi:acetylornithine deacetylase